MGKTPRACGSKKLTVAFSVDGKASVNFTITYKESKVSLQKGTEALIYYDLFFSWCSFSTEWEKPSILKGKICNSDHFLKPQRQNNISNLFYTGEKCFGIDLMYGFSLKCVFLSENRNCSKLVYYCFRYFGYCSVEFMLSCPDLPQTALSQPLNSPCGFLWLQWQNIPQHSGKIWDSEFLHSKTAMQTELSNHILYPWLFYSFS